jgi:riboflavin synthase
MFTGLVESMGVVARIAAEGAGTRIALAEPRLAAASKLGDSIAVSGVCLTVVEQSSKALSFEAGPETLAKTNLGELRVGDRVNLERALAVGDRLGGHIVQGHVDALGRIAKRDRQGDWETIWFSCPPALTRAMVPKGSIAVDGVSLTLVEVARDRFSVALIPHTLGATTLGFKAVGASVNLETDLISKHVVKYLEGLDLSEWKKVQAQG